jgi:hypothetical protein
LTALTLRAAASAFRKVRCIAAATDRKFFCKPFELHGAAPPGITGIADSRIL